MQTAFSRLLLFSLLLLSVSLANAATYTVTKTVDTLDGTCDADCSLREAATAANNTIDNDVIDFSALFSTAQTITLSLGDVQFTNNGSLTINGPGADLLTVSGNNTSRVFTATTGANVTINQLRVTGGNGVSTITTGRGGGIYNNASTLTINFVRVEGNTAANGGGLNNAGTATFNINNSIISGNSATGSGGGMQNFSGNTMNIRNSLISGNTSASTTTGGSAIQGNGTVSIINTTISGNNAGGGSGAIFANGALMTITNSTISGNTSGLNSGGIFRNGTNPVNIRNTIIAGNVGATGTPDVTGIYTSLGNNIIGNIGTAGSSGGWIGSDLQNVDPLLGPLANNGGFSRTMLPQTGSPAINGGQNCVVDLSCAATNPAVAVSVDQRGIPRPLDVTVDIGAVEVQPLYSVGGTVSSANGAIPNAIVTIANGSLTQQVKTNSFGRFAFGSVAAGVTYTLTVRAKGFTFQPVNVAVTNGDIANIQISALTSSRTENR